MKNIILIGMSGVGKTTIGHSLSKVLNKELIDMDDNIRKREGISIPDIFSLYGESYFRTLENDLITEICIEEGKIISTGGGVVLNPENMVRLKQNGIIILLQASIETLTKNILKSTQVRPLLNDKINMEKNIKQIYNGRRNLYLSNADYIINVDNKSVDKIIYEILERCVKINS